MATFLPTYIWLPALLAIAQTFLLLGLTIFVLKQIKWLQTPFAGMEYGDALSSGAVIIATIFISTANLPHLFDAARIFHDRHLNEITLVITLFSRFFLICILITLLYVILLFLSIRFIYKLRGEEDKSITGGLLKVSLILSIAWLCWLIAQEWVSFHTPVWVNID